MTFRQEYKPLNERQKELIKSIKDNAELLEDDFKAAIDSDRYALTCGREIALALTNLEQAVMWAVKGITK